MNKAKSLTHELFQRPVFSLNLGQPAELTRMTTSQVSCECGALYERTEFHSAPREADSFVCPACGHTLEIFGDVKAPQYRLILGPERKPEPPT
jgi:predicted SprT family Zn-dependent metalloprotease